MARHNLYIPQVIENNIIKKWSTTLACAHLLMGISPIRQNTKFISSSNSFLSAEFICSFNFKSEFPTVHNSGLFLLLIILNPCRVFAWNAEFLFQPSQFNENEPTMSPANQQSCMQPSYIQSSQSIRASLACMFLLLCVYVPAPFSSSIRNLSHNQGIYMLHLRPPFPFLDLFLHSLSFLGSRGLLLGNL